MVDAVVFGVMRAKTNCDLVAERIGTFATVAAPAIRVTNCVTLRG